MAIVLVKNAPRTNSVRAGLAEVLHLLFDVPGARGKHDIFDTFVLAQHHCGLILHRVEDLQQLLVLDELVEILGLDLCFATGALPGLHREDICDAMLTESVAAIRHHDGLLVIEGVLLLAPIARDQLLQVLHTLIIQ